jgi:pimeloyl-ACP methyl ester carboxylesterase
MTLALETAGAGDPLVLLHGVGTSRAVWHRAIPRLSAERRIVAVDMPGFGESDAAGEGFDIGEVADAIAAGLAAEGVDEPYDLYGQSLGGAVALSLAVRRPGAVRRLMLGAPAGFIARPQRLADGLGLGAELLIAARRELGTRLVGSARARRLLLAGVVADPERMDEDDARMMLEASRGAKRIRDGVAAGIAADLRPLLRRLERPLGLVWGDHDRVIPLPASRVIREIVPGAPLEIVPGAGHVPMVEAPGPFAAAVASVLDRLPVTAG